MAVASIRLEEHKFTPSLKLGWLQHPIYTGASPVQTSSWYTHFKPSPMESSCNHERGAEQENGRPLQFAMDLTSHMDRKWRCTKTNCENRRMVVTCLLFVPNPFLLSWIVKMRPSLILLHMDSPFILNSSFPSLSLATILSITVTVSSPMEFSKSCPIHNVIVSFNNPRKQSHAQYSHRVLIHKTVRKPQHLCVREWWSKHRLWWKYHPRKKRLYKREPSLRV